MEHSRRPCLAQKRSSSGQAGHGAVVGHDFDDDAGGFEAGEAAEVDGAFGLAGAFEDAAGAARRGKMWPGRERSSGLVAGSRRTLDGGGAFAGARRRW